MVFPNGGVVVTLSVLGMALDVGFLFFIAVKNLKGEDYKKTA